jgi:hypothetical protein
MKKIPNVFSKLFSYNFVSVVALDFFLIFALGWIVWEKPLPPMGSLGLRGYIGLFIVLTMINLLLERITERPRRRHSKG